jgi:hypothetical protein
MSPVSSMDASPGPASQQLSFAIGVWPSPATATAEGPETPGKSGAFEYDGRCCARGRAHSDRQSELLSASGPGLTLAADADIMSAMKTFTVRELDREPAAVLDACDREGAVRIRRRNGRTYTLRPEAGPDRITALPDFRARMKKIFPKPIPAAQSRLADKLLAGE